jgi:hypothetical protein
MRQDGPLAIIRRIVAMTEKKNPGAITLKKKKKIIKEVQRDELISLIFYC